MYRYVTLVQSGFQVLHRFPVQLHSCPIALLSNCTRVTQTFVHMDIGIDMLAGPEYLTRALAFLL